MNRLGIVRQTIIVYLSCLTAFSLCSRDCARKTNNRAQPKRLGWSERLRCRDGKTTKWSLRSTAAAQGKWEKKREKWKTSFGMSPNFYFAHRNTLVTCAVCRYSRVFPLHLITPATAALMTFPPLISAASRWKIANLCPALPAIIAARTTMESPDTVIKTFTRCHHLLVKFFFLLDSVFRLGYMQTHR